MSTSWKDFVDAFRIGSETGNIEKLSNIIAEDFDWVTSDMDRQATLSWTSTTSFRINGCLLYTSPSPRDLSTSRMPSSA